MEGLPWWFSGKESACQCRRHELAPWSGKISHAAEQLSLCATVLSPCSRAGGAAATEPTSCQRLTSSRPRAGAPQQEKPHWEAWALQQRVALAATKTQHSQKLNKKKNYFFLTRSYSLDYAIQVYGFKYHSCFNISILFFSVPFLP